jgi:two-component system, NtrC family, sensor kinase
LADLKQTIAELEQRLQASLVERDELVRQQAATAEVLAAINSSGFDLDRILQILVSTAARLCKTSPASIFLLEGDVYRFRTGQNVTEAFREHEKKTEIRAGRGLLVGRVAIEKGVVQIIDALEDFEYEDKEAASGNNFRSMLGVPLLRNGEPIGVFALARTRVEPFSESQIKLVSTFANQAVIAIENARLFRETKDALERQTATADILKVIASSPSDVQPVFEAIATSANKLIDGFSTAVVRYIGDELHLAAFTPTNPEADAALQAAFPGPISHFPQFMLVRDGQTTQFTDTEAEGVPPANRDLARLRGYRSMLFTPLMSSGAPIGLISVTRKDPGSFADHHVQLVRTFADQAVIAIENVRLFDEVKAKTADLSESLQQQTATADVLKVISRSAFDLQTVLETLIRSAVELSGALRGVIYLRDGELFRFRAASYGVNPAWLQFMKDTPQRAGRRSIVARTILTAQTVCIPDFLADSELQTWSTSLGAGSPASSETCQPALPQP